MKLVVPTIWRGSEGSTINVDPALALNTTFVRQWLVRKSIAVPVIGAVTWITCTPALVISELSDLLRSACIPSVVLRTTNSSERIRKNLELMIPVR